MVSWMHLDLTFLLDSFKLSTATTVNVFIVQQNYFTSSLLIIFLHRGKFHIFDEKVTGLL